MFIRLFFALAHIEHSSLNANMLLFFLSLRISYFFNSTRGLKILKIKVGGQSWDAEPNSQKILYTSTIYSVIKTFTCIHAILEIFLPLVYKN
ncbi:MAG: hypothetical protein DRP50_06300, partial [Thermotoga sp.]